jgi:hypothetical protein
VSQQDGLIQLRGTEDGHPWFFHWRRGNGRWRMEIWASGADPDIDAPRWEFGSRPTPRIDATMTESRARLIVQGCLAAFRVVGAKAPLPAYRHGAQKWRAGA